MIAQQCPEWTFLDFMLPIIMLEFSFGGSIYLMTSFILSSIATFVHGVNETAAYSGLIEPLPFHSKMWESICINFIPGLPKSHGKDAIQVVEDQLRKYALWESICIDFIAGLPKSHGKDTIQAVEDQLSKYAH